MLTYRGVMALFPVLLVLVSLLGVFGASANGFVEHGLSGVAPGPARDIVRSVLSELRHSHSAGVMALVGLVVALWQAYNWFAAFVRASNAVWDVPDGRPFWRTLPLQLGVTVLLVLVLTAGAVAIVLTGRWARALGRFLGFGDAALALRSAAAWPLLLVLASAVITLLYRMAPGARPAGMRRTVPGAVLAVLVWAGASAGFALYVAHFDSYNKAYGSLGGVVVFLVWMWFANLAVLLGAEFNAELARARPARSGGRSGGGPRTCRAAGGERAGPGAPVRGRP